MALLTREQILDADDLGSEVVDVPEWGGEVMVRGLTGSQRDAFEQEIFNSGERKERKIENLRASLVARAICNEEGTPLFSSRDVQVLGNKSARALTRVYEVAAKLSGLTADDVEELTEDFSETQAEPTS